MGAGQSSHSIASGLSGPQGMKQGNVAIGAVEPTSTPPKMPDHVKMERRRTAMSTMTPVSGEQVVEVFESAGKASPTAARQLNFNAPAGGSRTVADLRPKAGIVLAPDETIAEAAQLMASAKMDAGLVLAGANGDGATLEGIITDTDVVNKVLALGLEPTEVLVRDVMTTAPLCVRDNAPAIEALRTMLSLRCRHLPVVDAGGAVIGLLEIGKLLFDAMKVADQMSGAQRTLADVIQADEKNHASGKGCLSTNRLLQAATLMSERRQAVLVVDAEGKVSGILTPKDVLHRAVAANLPATTPVGPLMTPAPDLLPGDATVLQALHQLSTGGYRRAPVVDAMGGPLGVLDVLALMEAALQRDETPAEVVIPPPRPRTAPKLLFLLLVLGTAAGITVTMRKLKA